MKIKVMKKGFNYSQDGPGNRLVLHLQGCNMRCPWCSNPEGMALDGCLMATEGKLLAKCCPYGAIAEGRLDRNRCESCTTRECLTLHRNSGLRLSCSETTPELLVQEVLQSRPLLFDGGGVTVTGGEPTLQFEPLKMLLTELKKQGIHTAIETNGTHPRLDALFPLLDLLIIDFKHYDDHKHRYYTGVSNKTVKENLANAFANHPHLWVRTPLIDGVNAAAEDIDGFIQFYRGFDTANAAFELLPYHEYGKVKWQQCGLKYTMKGGNVTPKQVKDFETAYKQAGLKLIHT